MKYLKKIASTIMALLLISINFLPVFAKAYDIDKLDAEITLDEQYVILNSSNLNKHSELVLEMGYTTESFLPVIKDESINIYAVKSATKEQVISHSYTTSLSTAIIDFTSQPAENKSSITNKMLESLSSQNYIATSPGTVMLNGVEFVTLEVTVPPDENNEKGFTYIQYYTIMDSQEIDLVFYFNDPEITDANRKIASDIFYTLKFKTDSPIKNNDVMSLVVVLVTIAIVVLVALAIFIIYSIMRDVRFNIKYNRPDKIDHTFKRK